MRERLNLKELKFRFSVHKRTARYRGIEFKLEFRDWLRIWEESGKLNLRGSGGGKYCMGRFGDVGPYEMGNVYITLNSENIKSAHKGRVFTTAHRQKLSEVKMGKKLSDEHRQAIRKANTGKKFSELHKQRLSDSLKKVTC